MKGKVVYSFFLISLLLFLVSCAKAPLEPHYSTSAVNIDFVSTPGEERDSDPTIIYIKNYGDYAVDWIRLMSLHSENIEGIQLVESGSSIISKTIAGRKHFGDNVFPGDSMYVEILSDASIGQNPEINLTLCYPYRSNLQINGSKGLVNTYIISRGGLVLDVSNGVVQKANNGKQDMDINLMTSNDIFSSVDCNNDGYSNVVITHSNLLNEFSCGHLERVNETGLVGKMKMERDYSNLKCTFEKTNDDFFINVEFIHTITKKIVYSR